MTWHVNLRAQLGCAETIRTNIIRYLMVRFTVLLIFKQSSNNALCGPRETDARAAKPILWPFA